MFILKNAIKCDDIETSFSLIMRASDEYLQQKLTTEWMNKLSGPANFDAFLRDDILNFIGSFVLPSILPEVQRIYSETFNYFFLPRLICTVAEHNIPERILCNFRDNTERLHGSLNPHLSDRNKDVFYFYDNPPHCDVVDMPRSTHNFLTVLIPLTRRDGDYAPLFVKQDASGGNGRPFDKKSRESGQGSGLYEGDTGCFERIIPKVGDALVWHADEYHWVKPNLTHANVYNLRLNLSTCDHGVGLDDLENSFRIHT